MFLRKVNHADAHGVRYSTTFVCENFRLSPRRRHGLKAQGVVNPKDCNQAKSTSGV